MSNTHKQVDYDRIARKIDGESVRLNPQEQEIFLEMVSAEHELLANLNVAVPVGAVERATKRATAALSKPSKASKLLFGFGVTVGIAVAAAIVISSIATVLHQSNQYDFNTNQITPNNVRVIADPINSAGQINDSVDFNQQNFFDQKDKPRLSDQDNIFSSPNSETNTPEDDKGDWIEAPGSTDTGATEL